MLKPRRKVQPSRPRAVDQFRAIFDGGFRKDPWKVADKVGFTDRSNSAEAGIGEHPRLARNGPASSPNRCREEAGDLAAVVCRDENDALSYPSSPLRLRQSAIVPGVDSGHHTRDAPA